MMTVVPLRVSDASVVSVVLNHLLFGDLEARSVLKFPVGEVEQTIRLPASERGFSIVSGNRWSHGLVDHDVVFRHFNFNYVSIQSVQLLLLQKVLLLIFITSFIYQ